MSRKSSDDSGKTTFSSYLFSRQSSKKRKGSGGSSKSDRSASPVDCPSSPSRSKKFANFASRSLRKSQWRLFKHRTFFGSQRNSQKQNANQLQLPRLTLRHPSIDSTAMPLTIDGDEHSSELLPIRATQRRWTDSESVAERCYRVHSEGRLRDSRDSSGFDDSHDQLDDVLPQAMTAPVSPSVPLSASSSQSEGWKYSSQKILWKLKPRYIGFSHNSSTSSSCDSAWKSLDSGTWRHSLDDKELVLRGAQLETLSEIEKGALQLVAAQRLAKILPGISLTKPKDPLAVLRQKRQKLIKSSRTLTVGDVSRRPSGSTDDEKRVFGVSLTDCMQNERRHDLETRCRSLDDSAVCLSVPRSHRTSSTGNGSKSCVRSEPEFINSIDNNRKWLYPSTQDLYPSTSSHPTSPSPLVGSAPAGCLSAVSTKEVNYTTNQLGELQGRFIKKQRPSSASLSYSLDGTIDDVEPHPLRVPRIVENCTQYLIAYGLSTVGLFRVAGNNKRCRQLRSALEKVGGGVAICDDMVENTTAHDVATLLKEYFRDLPQSLLPKEHYQAYIAAAKLTLDERIECLRLLVALLPTPSIDTVFVLLKFLHEVSLHSADKVDEQGETITQGNKMDVRNLATIFAPCILRPDHDKLHASLAENESQVTTMETMISQVEEIFRIPKDLQCKIYNKLRETEPNRLDRVLDHLARAEGLDHPLTSPFPTVEEDSVPTERVHPPPLEKHANGKTKVCSQRSGSWPFSLRSPRAQRFFPSQDSVGTSSGYPTETESAKDASTSNIGGIVNDPPSRELAAVTTGSVSDRSPSRERDNFRSAARSGAAAARRRLRNVVRAFRFTTVTRSTPNMAQL